MRAFVLCSRPGWIAALIVYALLLGVAVSASAHPYFNSAEPGCDGSNPAVLVCDDFEHDGLGNTPGTWFFDTEVSGQLQPRQKGWGAPITSNPTGAAVCGAGVTPFGNCAATGGNHGGIGGQNMGLHDFKTPSCGTNGTQLCPVSEVYVRWYAKWPSGYQWAAEKHMNLTIGDSGIAFANIQLNCGADSRSPEAFVKTQVIFCDPDANTNPNANAGCNEQSD